MAIMVIHPFSLARLSLFLPILIHSYQYSASASPTCSPDSAATFEDLRRIPVSSLFPSRRDGGDHGGNVVFGVVHVKHSNILQIQSLGKVRNIPHPEGRSSLIQGRLQRGLQREKILNRATREERTSINSRSTRMHERKHRRLVEDERATVVAAGGEYMVEMQIGTPPKPVLLILDTGSGLSWVQCKQCVQCSPQKDPLFDPSASSSYKTISCQSPSCLKSSSEFQCNTLNNTCEYGVQYGQSSFTTGIVSNDNLQVLNGAITISDFLFGCGLFSMGDFVGNSGLLGLSRSNVSFPSQLKIQYPTFGRKFTLCLADLAHNLSATGFISFGDLSFNSSSASSARSQDITGPQNEILYTPFAQTPFPTQFYYVGLKGISVDGKLLPINSSVLELDQAGDGGTVIDSGTTLTLLNPPAYGALRDAFRVAGDVRGRLPKVSADGFNSTGHVIDTCYQLNDSQISNWTAREMIAAVPSVALHFVGDVELFLPPDNVLFPFDESLYCLAFASTLSDLGINVIGNIQQQNLRIVYDLENSRFGLQSVTGCDR